MKVVKAHEGTAAEYIKVQEIQGDMGETERMQLLQGPDGDVMLTMYNVEKQQIGSIEFCTSNGGGRYPVIAKKLRELVAELVALDESPWGNTSEITTFVPVKAWIPVTGRLPSGQWSVTLPNWSEEVLIANTAGISIGYYDRNNEAWYVSEGPFGRIKERIDKITHWMPLPVNPYD